MFNNHAWEYILHYGYYTISIMWISLSFMENDSIVINENCTRNMWIKWNPLSENVCNINVWEQIYSMFNKLFPYWEWLTIYGKIWWLSDFTLTCETFTNNYYKIPTGEQKKTMELVHNTVIIVRIILLPISWVR